MSAPAFPQAPFPEKVNKAGTVIVVAPDLPQTHTFISSLATVLAGNYRPLLVEPSALAVADISGADYVIALGSGSLQAVRDKKISVPLISSYITSAFYEKSLGKDANETALFSSMDWEMQIKLAKTLLPSARNAGILVSPEFRGYVQDLEKIALKNGIRLTIAEWKEEDNLIRELNLLLKKTDFILAVEDPKVFNANTIRNILLAAYRNGKVVIGPNASYVKAGSLATIWCSESDIAVAVNDIIRYPPDNGHLPEPRAISCSSVAINRQVAKSLSIPIPDTVLHGKLIFEKGQK